MKSIGLLNCALLTSLIALSGCADPGGRGTSDAAGGVWFPEREDTDGPGGKADDPNAPDEPGDTEDGFGTTGGDDGDDAPGAGSGPKFDVGEGEETTGPADACADGACDCSIPDHVPCDVGTQDPFHAMGLGCAGELQVQMSTSGPGSSIGVRTAFGNTNSFDPREGSSYAVIGTGLLADLDNQTPGGDDNANPTHCNDDIGNYDMGGSLPSPLRVNDVGGNCQASPALVGTGDCSNTVESQFQQGLSPQGSQPGANDYVEMRFEVDVPLDVTSFSYDFAFFSTEYPYYFNSNFNDMYVGWLESEAWTGNISFDAAGNPISLNAGFLSITDDAGNAPELAGTCMRQHASTGWLTTTTGVTPGEHLTVVFGVFDLGDSILDSYVFLDNFEWGCEPAGPPTTEPEG